MYHLSTWYLCKQYYWCIISILDTTIHRKSYLSRELKFQRSRPLICFQKITLRSVWHHLKCFMHSFDSFNMCILSYQVESINDLPENETITVYRCGSLVDLCSGPHIRNTSLVKAFACLEVRLYDWDLMLAAPAL